VSDQINLLDLVPDEAERVLREFAVARGEPAYRGAQVVRRLWRNPAASFDAMSDLPRAFRALLTEHFPCPVS
jgi:23S rRNA (adenine2503-C2)-methyltransferase